MNYYTIFDSPIGDLLTVGDGESLNRLHMLGSRKRVELNPAWQRDDDAFDDVRSHEMAVMAGVQTALMGLLKRFEPTALEKRLEPGMLGNILPSARKARTWELFCTTYKSIATEAQEDFQSVFGREFARAYDAQMQKL